MNSPEQRLAFFVKKLRKHGKDIKWANIDMTDPCGYIIQVAWKSPITDNSYCLIAAQDLKGFSVYRTYGDEDLSEDDAILDCENDSDIDKV